MTHSRDKAALYWRLHYSAAASREGWDLFEVSPHSSFGEWQIQKLDGRMSNPLKSDDDAWDIVLHGREPHHAFARDFIRKFSPDEWVDAIRGLRGANRINSTRIDPELLGEITAVVLSA